jgi:uncharacterized membrane protein
MLTEQDRRFVEYWENNRAKERKTLRQFMVGVPFGLVFAIPILVILFSGRFWYERADAVANAKVNPVVLIIAILLITAFVAIFYKKHQWDQKEQLYQEIKAKQAENDLNQ